MKRKYFYSAACIGILFVFVSVFLFFKTRNSSIAEITVSSSNVPLVETVKSLFQKTAEPEHMPAESGEHTTVSCPVKTEGIEGTLVMYGSSVHITGTIPATPVYESMTDIMRVGKTVYLWNSDTGRGYKIDVFSAPESADTYSSDDLISALSNLGIDHVKCTHIDHNESLFDVPTDIIFHSFSEQAAAAFTRAIEEALLDKFRGITGK